MEREKRQKVQKKQTRNVPTLLILNLVIIGLVILGIALLNKSTYLTVEATALNVRTGPGLDYKIQSQIKSGTKLAVLKKQKEWYQVTLPDGKTGWVASWLIGDKNTTPVTNIAATINTEGAKLRDNPGTDTKILQELKKDTAVTITLAQDGWSQVQVGDTVGWISSDLVTETTTKVAEETDTSQEVYTREDTTNVRKEPNIESEIVTTLEQGTSVKVLETVDDWYKIETPDQQVGYVANWVVNTGSRSKNALATSISEATIMLDAGHGGADGGASTSNETIFEKDLTLSTVKLLQKNLEKTGAKVILTRDDDSWVELIDRSNLSNQLKPDVFISIHYDATDEQNIASGTHVFYYYPEDKNLAQIVDTHLSSLPLPNHGASYNDLSVTRENTQPALLLELGYMSTNKDVSYIITKDYQQQAADAITAALTEYFQ